MLPPLLWLIDSPQGYPPEVDRFTTSSDRRREAGVATLKDVAAAAGVSRTTVSNAYNRPGKLSAALRARILTAARELGYPGPDPVARGLRTGRVGAIGFLLAEALTFAFDDPAAVLLLRGVAEIGQLADVGLSLLPSPPERPEGAATASQAVTRAAVDGFLVYHLPEDHPGMLAVRGRRLPAVVVDGPDLPGVPFVGVDDRGGARRAAEHLLALGHRRIGVLVDRIAADAYRGPVDDRRRGTSGFRASNLRLAGYADALRGAGLAWQAVPIQECGVPDRASGHAGATALLDRAPELTAILATTDLLAKGAIQAAGERGLPVPAALSVVGFDDLPDSASAGLTTVHQPLADKGRVAARLLLQALDGAATPASRVELPTRLVPRGSTAPPRSRR
jgi:DNA-binding LacI/PurR family transcriptional regulator